MGIKLGLYEGHQRPNPGWSFDIYSLFILIFFWISAYLYHGVVFSLKLLGFTGTFGKSGCPSVEPTICNETSFTFVGSVTSLINAFFPITNLVLNNCI